MTLASTGIFANDASGATNFTINNSTGTLTLSTQANNSNINITPYGSGIVDIDGEVKIRGGNPGSGKILVSDADGAASWQAGYTFTSSGTYTPTLTNVTNVTSSKAFECMWMQVGNVVHVSGKVQVTATSATTATRLEMSLPSVSGYSPDIVDDYDLNGTAFGTRLTMNEPAGFQGDAADVRAALFYISNHNSQSTFYFTFTYKVAAI